MLGAQQPDSHRCVVVCVCVRWRVHARPPPPNNQVHRCWGWAEAGANAKDSTRCFSAADLQHFVQIRPSCSCRSTSSRISRKHLPL